MKTVEIDIYTPKEVFAGTKDFIKLVTRVSYYWNKTRKIRKPYGITWKTEGEEIAKRMSDEDKEKFIATFPEDLQDRVYFVVHRKFRARVPKGEFR